MSFLHVPPRVDDTWKGCFSPLAGIDVISTELRDSYEDDEYTGFSPLAGIDVISTGIACR